MKPIITENLLKLPIALHQFSNKFFFFFICTENVLVQTEQYEGVLLFAHLLCACPLNDSVP